MFCQQCGSAVADDAVFCSSCGAPIAGKSAAQAATAQAVPAGAPSAGTVAEPLKENALTRKLNDRVVLLGGEFADRRVASMGWKHMLASLLAVLVLVFWFVPAVTLNVPVVSFFNSENVEISMSMGNPMGDPDAASTMDESDIEEYKFIFAVLMVPFDLLPMLLALWLTVRPLLKKNVVKRRRLIFSRLVAISTLGKLLLWRVVVGEIVSAADRDYGELAPTLRVTLGGWILLILTVAWIVTLGVLARENKRQYVTVRVA